MLSGSARFWQDPQKYADPRIQIQGVKYQPKTTFVLKPNSKLLKKWDYKISSMVHQVLE